MDTGVRRGLGLALIGLLTWAVTAMVVALINPSTGVEQAFGLIALIGIVALVAGLGRVAWVLLRR